MVEKPVECDGCKFYALEEVTCPSCGYTIHCAKVAERIRDAILLKEQSGAILQRIIDGKMVAKCWCWTP
ncbi:MAG TPA: hypothetical protein VI864_06785 [Candidatus Bathyarchaeia archaeon]|nr:hypothetical protein [Candidatus Bathyarchaeia archaeon]